MQYESLEEERVIFKIETAPPNGILIFSLWKSCYFFVFSFFFASLYTETWKHLTQSCKNYIGGFNDDVIKVKPTRQHFNSQLNIKRISLISTRNNSQNVICGCVCVCVIIGEQQTNWTREKNKHNATKPNENASCNCVCLCLCVCV